MLPGNGSGHIEEDEAGNSLGVTLRKGCFINTRRSSTPQRTNTSTRLDRGRAAKCKLRLFIAAERGMAIDLFDSCFRTTLPSCHQHYRRRWKRGAEINERWQRGHSLPRAESKTEFKTKPRVQARCSIGKRWVLLHPTPGTTFKIYVCGCLGQCMLATFRC